MYGHIGLWFMCICNADIKPTKNLFGQAKQKEQAKSYSIYSVSGRITPVLCEIVNHFSSLGILTMTSLGNGFIRFMDLLLATK